MLTRRSIVDVQVMNLQALCLHLLYKQELLVVEDIGVEPMTPCVQGRCSSQLS